MKKILNRVKHNTLFGIIIGIVICSISLVLAESINSDEVLYDNSNGNTSNDNVQDALDDIYNIIDHNSVGFSLLTNTPTGLSSELVGGLYRYQGVQNINNTVDNYICFGTTNKSDCVSDTDKYMYRIIGINPSGQMKLIKKEALNTAYAWISSGEVDWAHSDLYNGLNDSYFLTNTTYVPDNTWSNRIAATNWYYTELTNANVDAETMYINETSGSTVSAKIGILYIHDYYYGLSGGNNCFSSPNICKTSWLHMLNNDDSPPDTTNEWLLTKYNGFIGWSIKDNGQMYSGDYSSGYNWAGWNKTIRDAFSIRPVFFIRATERIASGSGTLTDPYILS